MMPFSMKPVGWYQVGWSKAVAAGDVITKHYFGQDLVLFRDRDGGINVLDAYCQHLGAHLGFGGCVVDGGIRCPFHGWVWDGSGANVEIPYQDTPNRARRIRAWTTAEHDGLILVWHDEAGRSPLWDAPSLGGTLDPRFVEHGFHDPFPDGACVFEHKRIHPQMIVENAVDPHHFRFVHGSGVSPKILRQDVDEFAWRATVGFGRKWQDEELGDDLNGTLSFVFSGPGYGSNGFAAPDGDKVIVIAATPIDDEHSDVFSTTWLPRVPAFADPATRRAIYEQSRDILADDVNIWDHQHYLDSAPLAPDEVRGFNRIRRWARTFYPGTPEFADAVATPTE
jgi:3-ketosteroid 9alpha-monooxygenase subunit A